MNLFESILKKTSPIQNPVENFMSWFTPTKPTVQQATSTPTQPVQQNQKPTLFADEQNAYNAMINDWLPEQEAISLVKKRREGLASGLKLTPIEATALRQMAQDGLSSEESLQLLAQGRALQKDAAKTDFEKKYAQGNLLQKGAYNALMLGAGATEKTLQYGWNILDFVTFWKLGFWEDVKKMQEVTKSAEFDSTAFSVGRALPDVAMAVAPIWWVWVAWKWLMWAVKTGAKVGAIYWWVNPILEKWGEATAWDITQGAMVWGAIGGTIPLVWAWLSKVKQLVTSNLPKSLVSSWLMTPTKLKEASMRLSKLSDEWMVNVWDAPQWMLDKWIQWSKETIQKQLTDITSGAIKQKAQLFAQQGGKTYKWVQAVNDLQQAMIEVLPNYASVTKTGIIPKAWNSDKVTAILEFATNPNPTAKQIDEARTILWQMGIFSKTWEMVDTATKEWLQKVWINASKFLDETLPWFRSLNKDIEVANAMKDAIWLKEAQDFARQHITLVNSTLAWIGGTYGYAKEWDISWAIKGAWVAVWAKYILNNPAVTTFIAQKLKSLWGGKMLNIPLQKTIIKGTTLKVTKPKNDKK